MPELPFSEFGLKWFEDIVAQITAWFTDQITAGYLTLTNELFATPLPEGSGLDVVFSAPASDDTPWHDIYESVVGGEVMLLALVLLFLTVQGRHFVRIFDFGSPYRDRRTRRNAWTGGVLIVAWYWVGVLALYFVRGVAIGVIPDLATVAAALLDMLPAAAGNPMLTLILAAAGGLAMALLKAVFFLRDILLYIYLYGMPIGLALAFGNLPILSRIAMRLCQQFVPLALLPLPAAMLFRGYALLFSGDVLVQPADAFLNYFTVVSLPVIALYVTWKTFRYASPLVAGAYERVAKTAVTVGAVAGAGYVAGTGAAVTTARWGPKAGLGQAAVSRLTPDGGSDPDPDADTSPTTAQDNLATTATGGVPAYRRRKNDPAYY